MEQSEKYSYEVNPNAQTAAAAVLRYAGEGHKILELGAGPGSITRHLAAAPGNDVTVGEIDPGFLTELQSLGVTAVRTDLNDQNWTNAFGDQRFDRILFPDVLEHLDDPQETLKQSLDLLAEDGRVVVSLPHVGHAAVRASLMKCRFPRTDMGFLDRTHTQFYGLQEMRQLIEAAGLKIADAHFVEVHPRRTELAEHWRALGPVARRVLRSDPWSDVCQLVSLCVPADRPGKKIQPDQLTPRQLDGAMGRPSLRVRSKSLRKLLSKIGITSRGR